MVRSGVGTTPLLRCNRGSSGSRCFTRFQTRSQFPFIILPIALELDRLIRFFRNLTNVHFSSSTYRYLLYFLLLVSNDRPAKAFKSSRQWRRRGSYQSRFYPRRPSPNPLRAYFTRCVKALYMMFPSLPINRLYRWSAWCSNRLIRQCRFTTCVNEECLYGVCKEGIKYSTSTRSSCGTVRSRMKGVVSYSHAPDQGYGRR